MNFLNYVLTIDVVNININYSYQAADKKTRHNFFTYRTGMYSEKLAVWNNLPADNTDFSNLNSFKRSITSTFLASYCKVYFF